jgi:hypothetical protein
MRVSSTSATTDTPVPYPWDPKKDSADSTPDVESLKKQMEALSKQLQEAWKTAGQSPENHARVMMLTSQITALQRDITQITNTGVSSASAARAHAEMLRTVAAVEATSKQSGAVESGAAAGDATQAANSQAVLKASASDSSAQNGSAPFRFDHTGTNIDTVV